MRDIKVVLEDSGTSGAIILKYLRNIYAKILKEAIILLIVELSLIE